MAVGNLGTDIHGDYTSYLFIKGHSLHPLMNTVHNIWIIPEARRAVIRRRGCSTIPLRLLKHMKWYLGKYHDIDTMEVR